jgi:hypothetical protein
MPIKDDSPVVFISYAWSSVEHETWIIDFSTRLFHVGVVVKLDKWDLAPGQDKNSFMEQMVHDEKIKYVLVVCDSVYQEKANTRKGGVGTETLIISNEVYTSVEQRKFIPILKEYDAFGKPCLPTYLSSRIYIDFSKSEAFEESFEKLLRIVFDRPSIKKPELGLPPSFLFDSDLRTNKSSSTQRQAVHALKAEKLYSNGLVDRYLSEVLDSLEEFSIKYAHGDDAYDEKVLDSIRKMSGIRDEYLELFDTVALYNPSFDFDKIVDFFSNLNVYFDTRKVGVGYTKIDSDNFKYLGEDLFLSSVAILLKRGKYSALENIIYGPYFPKDVLQRPRGEEYSCSFLNHYLQSFEEIRKKRLNSNLISLTAEIMKENVSKIINFNEIIVAEAVVFNATLLNTKRPPYGRDWWYPRTGPYIDHEVDLSFFQKLVSIKHFEKVKGIFKVTSRSELIEKMTKSMEYLKESRISFGWHSNPPLIQHYVDQQKLATI